MEVGQGPKVGCSAKGKKMRFGPTESYRDEFDLSDYILPSSPFFWFGHS
jgi:hypothetical protein